MGEVFDRCFRAFFDSAIQRRSPVIQLFAVIDHWADIAVWFPYCEYGVDAQSVFVGGDEGVVRWEGAQDMFFIQPFDHLFPEFYPRFGF